MPVAERRGLPAEITQESRRRGGRFARDAGQALGITRDIGDRHGEANGGTFGGVACGQHDDKPADQPCSPPRRGW